MFTTGNQDYRDVNLNEKQTSLPSEPGFRLNRARPLEPTLESVQTKMENKLLAYVLVLLSIFVQVRFPFFITIHHVIHKLQAHFVSL